MNWLKPDFRNIQDAEHTTYRGLGMGFGAILAGLILTLAVAPRMLGVGVMAAGGLIVLGEIIWFTLATRHATTTNCTRCGKANPVFPEERHVRCTSCGHVMILRES